MAMQNGLMSGEDKKKLDGYTAVSNESGKFMSASGTWQTPKDDDSWATESLSVETVSGAFNIKKKDGTTAFSIPRESAVSAVTGVKGNAESTYRTGNVNLTAANIGAAASDHTHTNYAAATHTHNYAGSSSAGGSATSAVKLDGFTKAATQTWGNQTGTFVTGMNDDAGGSMGFRKNCPSSGKLSLFVDGLFYQNEGTYPCLDTSSTYTLTETTTGIQVKNSAGTVVCTIPLAGYY